jgi:3-oxoacyl-[acyl-carrier-protein] synthase II
MMREVVITGIGIISPLGFGKDGFWDLVRRRDQSLSRKHDADARGSEEAGLIRNFDEHAYMDAKTSKYAQRAEKLALASTRLALEDAGLDSDSSQEMRLGVSLGSMTSNLSAAASFDKQVLRGETSFIDPSLVPSGIMNSLSGIVSIKNRIHGFHVPVAAGEASGTQAIQFALTQLENDRVDAVLAGGVEDICQELRLVECVRNGLPDATDAYVSERSQRAGNKEYGYFLSEAAAILLLESTGSAARRGAKSYAECAGFGCSYVSRGEPNREKTIRVAVRTLEQAFRVTDIAPADIDLVFTSFTVEVAYGCSEMEVIRQFFGRRMPEIICIKSIIGDSLGASGALQTAAAALALKDSAMTSPENYSKMGASAVPTQRDSKVKEVRNVLISSFSSSGHISFLVLRKSDF